MRRAFKRETRRFELGIRVGVVSDSIVQAFRQTLELGGIEEQTREREREKGRELREKATNNAARKNVKLHLMKQPQLLNSHFYPDAIFIV